MDQRKLMDNANTITDMAKVKFWLKSYVCQVKVKILDAKHRV